MPGPWEKYQQDDSAPAAAPVDAPAAGPWQKYAAQDASSGSAFTPSNSQDPTMQNLKTMGLSALGTGLKGLDYQRGATTGPAIAKLLDAIPGGKPVFDPQEAENQRSFKSTYPTPVQMLERKYGKLPDGPSVRDVFPSAKGHWYDFTTKGLADGVATAATDPATYESMGLSALAKTGAGGSGVLAQLARASGLATETGLGPTGKALSVPLRPVEAILGGKAKGNYAKAFEEADRLGQQEGNPHVVSDLLRKQGFQGDMDQARAAVGGINDTAGKGIGAVITAGSDAGASVPFLDGVAKPAFAEVQRLRAIPDAEAHAQADAVLQKVFDIHSAHPENVPIEVAQNLRKFTGDMMTKAGHAGEAATSPTQAARQVLEKDVLHPGIEQAVPDALKPEFQAQKALYQSTDGTIQDKLLQMANKVKERRGPWSASDISAMLAGSAAGGAVGAVTHGAPGALVGGMTGPLGALLVKQAKQAYQSTSGRTLRGALEERLGPGTQGLLDPAIRRGAWSLLNDGDDNKDGSKHGEKNGR